MIDKAVKNLDRTGDSTTCSWPSLFSIRPPLNIVKKNINVNFKLNELQILFDFLLFRFNLFILTHRLLLNPRGNLNFK